MAPLLISIRGLILFLVFIQSVSLYKIYASDDNHSNFLSNSLSSSLNEDTNQVLPTYDDEDDTKDSDENKDQSAAWLSLISELKQQKRSAYPIRFHSSKALPQRRNNRPHWNPLVAAYKRCGELSTAEERESCFKDAIQMLFVHKLRK